MAERNKLERALDKLADDDRYMMHHILGFCHWFAPCEKEEILKRLVFDGYSREVVLLLMKHLASKDLITLTRNYCLPKDKLLCEAAGLRIMDEIIAELDAA